MGYDLRFSWAWFLSYHICILPYLPPVKYAIYIPHLHGPMTVGAERSKYCGIFVDIQVDVSEIYLLYSTSLSEHPLGCCSSLHGDRQESVLLNRRSNVCDQLYMYLYVRLYISVYIYPSGLSIPFPLYLWDPSPTLNVCMCISGPML